MAARPTSPPSQINRSPDLTDSLRISEGEAHIVLLGFVPIPFHWTEAELKYSTSTSASVAGEGCTIFPRSMSKERLTAMLGPLYSPSQGIAISSSPRRGVSGSEPPSRAAQHRSRLGGVEEWRRKIGRAPW